MNSRVKKLVIPLIIALVLTGSTLVIAGAQSETPPATPDPAKECASCHPEHYAGWHTGAHGDIQAGKVSQEEMNCTACHKDTNFITGQQQGKPDQTSQDDTQSGGKQPLCLSCHSTGYDPATGKTEAAGITCKACHGEMSADHPTKKMPVADTTDLCRKCHSESRFNWDSWKNSIHYQANMKCTACHDPHTTKFKLVDAAVTDPSDLCINCHKDQAKDYQHSIHAESNVSCVDCHLGPRKGKDDFHQVPDHSFMPSLDTCNGCHANQMHSIGEAIKPAGMTASIVKTTETTTPVPLLTPVPAVTSNPPAPANFIGFAGMAGLIGLLGGVIFRTLKNR